MGARPVDRPRERDATGVNPDSRLRAGDRQKTTEDNRATTVWDTRGARLSSSVALTRLVEVRNTICRHSVTRFTSSELCLPERCPLRPKPTHPLTSRRIVPRGPSRPAVITVARPPPGQRPATLEPLVSYPPTSRHQRQTAPTAAIEHPVAAQLDHVTPVSGHPVTPRQRVILTPTLHPGFRLSHRRTPQLAMPAGPGGHEPHGPDGVDFSYPDNRLRLGTPPVVVSIAPPITRAGTGGVSRTSRTG